MCIGLAHAQACVFSWIKSVSFISGQPLKSAEVTFTKAGFDMHALSGCLRNRFCCNAGADKIRTVDRGKRLFMKGECSRFGLSFAGCIQGDILVPLKPVFSVP